ncbi:Sushi SCR CCP domain containing protein, protein [Aphelenchoides fujianensis]|nr:Sushi SCR CCP domain containing protein, protein [Aphelenchoides fujianensis]
MGSNPRLFLLLFAFLPALVFGEHCPRFAERTDGEISYDPEDEAALRLGSIATLNCNNGNIRRSRCTSAGWKPQTFTRCEPVSRDESHNFGGISPPQAGGCPSITNLSNGFVVYSPMGLAPYRQDTLATLNCHLGFVNSGPQSARCEHGRWTELGSCETSTSQQCSQLPDVPNGQLSYIAGPKGPFAADSVAELSCKLGFSPVGNSRVKCGKTGWEPFPGIGRCEEKRSSRSKRQLGIGMNGQCTGLTVPNGQVNYIQANPSQPYASGTTAFLICNPGFSPQGAPSSLVAPYCTGNLWSPSLGSCQSTGGIGGIGNPGLGGIGGIGGIGGQGTCPAMLAPLNGQLTYSMGGNLGPFPSGTTVSLVCQPGFVSNSGLTTASCQNSVWQPSSLGPCSPSNGLGGIGSPGFGGIGGHRRIDLPGRSRST